MVQTSFRTDSGSDSERIVVPIGTVRLVRSGFRRYRLHELLNSFKEEGVPLSKVMENLCIACLIGDYSMNDWDQVINRSPLRKEFYCGEHEIRRWTFQRDLCRVGDYLEEVVEHLTKVSRVLYPNMPTHAYVDGSHIKRYGSKGKNVRYGEGGGTVQLQDQFMLASLIATGTPVSIELYPGNQNDPQQYSDFIPQLLFLLKRGSMIVMDNGGSSAKILDEIVEYGDSYITRVRINGSDEKIIENEKERMVYVGMGTACIMHTFGSSGRTIYLFFSVDSYAASISRAERAVAEKEIERIRAQDVITHGKAEKLIKFPKNPFYQVVIDGARIVMTDDPWVELDPGKELKDAIPPKGGWFKLECSFPMDPRLVLVIYRHRVDIEHQISSLKSVVNLDPFRVWIEGSTRGKLVLGIISQFILSAAIYDMASETVTKDIDGKPVNVKVKSAPKTILKELNRYQGMVSRYEWGGFKIDGVKDEGVIDPLVSVIERYERESPVSLPERASSITLPAAQWGRKEKNCKDLATLIAQWYEKTIFPEYMIGRRHWKDIDPVTLGRFSKPERNVSESKRTPSILGKESYYQRQEGRSGK